MAREIFRKTFRRALERKFGAHKITARELAQAYNLQTHDPISEETARKWLNGLSLPRYERIIEMVNWLQIEPNELFNYKPARTAETVIDNIETVTLSTLKNLLK